MYRLEKKSDIEKERRFVEAVKLVFTVKSFFLLFSCILSPLNNVSSVLGSLLKTDGMTISYLICFFFFFFFDLLKVVLLSDIRNICVLVKSAKKLWSDIRNISARVKSAQTLLKNLFSIKVWFIQVILMKYS